MLYAFVSFQISLERMRDDITAPGLCQGVFLAIFLQFYKTEKLESVCEQLYAFTRAPAALLAVDLKEGSDNS